MHAHCKWAAYDWDPSNANVQSVVTAYVEGGPDFECAFTLLHNANGGAGGTVYAG